MKLLHELTSWIRDYTQDPRHLATLMSDEFSWYQLCTALDTVDDTEEAIRSYLGGDYPPTAGERYLRIYGVLQALYIQQDSLDVLINAVHPTTTIKVRDVLQDVRLARHRGAGHPTRVGPRGGPFSTHAIVRHSMRKEGFQLLSFPRITDDVFQSVDVLGLIEKQNEETNRILLEIIEDLRKQDEAHRSQFRSVKMESVLSNLSYSFEKIFEELRKPSDRALSGWAVEHLRTVLNQFEKQLIDRGLTKESYDSIKYRYLDIEYPLTQLAKYIANEPSEIASDQGAVVFTEALQRHFDDLRNLALEIDEEYASVPKTVARGS